MNFLNLGHPKNLNHNFLFQIKKKIRKGRKKNKWKKINSKNYFHKLSVELSNIEQELALKYSHNEDFSKKISNYFFIWNNIKFYLE